VLNGGRSRLRWRRRRRENETDLPLEVRARGDLATRGADRATVLQILRTLPERQRQVLVLRYYLDLSEAEIAAELRISPGSVKTHASRGLAALAGVLEAPR
ncbi:MAG: sigma-70 family RNA polymerase sigma factor, partial [Nocardioidaceae bacterium]